MIYHLRWFIALLLPVPIAALAQESRAQTPAFSGAVRAKTESEIPGAGPRGARGTSGVPEYEARIDGQVLALSRESLAESLTSLALQDMYNWPGPFVTFEAQMVPCQFPVPIARGARDVECLFSNRRFLKVYGELMDLDRNTAGVLVLERLRASRQVYGRLLDEYVAQPWFRTAAAPSSGPSVIGWPGGDGKDGSPTLRGTRFQVLSLVLLAGVLKLETVHGEIVDLAAYACRQRQSYSDSKAYNPYAGSCVLEALSLYSRQILGTALLLTLPPGVPGDGPLPPGVSLVEKKLTKWDAVYTIHDLPVTMRGLPPDFSKGTLRVQYLAAMDDTTFDALVARCR